MSVSSSTFSMDLSSLQYSEPSAGLLSMASDSISALGTRGVEDIEFDDDGGISDLLSTIDPDDPSFTKNAKVRAMLLTFYPPDTEQKWLLPLTYFRNTAIIKNWCSQFETCPTTGKPHVHVFLEFHHDKALRFNPIRKAFIDAGVTPPDIRKTRRVSAHARKCVVNYVLCPDKRRAFDDVFVWPHNTDTLDFDKELWNKRPTKKSKRDIETDRIIKHIESKPKFWSWDRIVHETDDSKRMLAQCSWGKKFHEGRTANEPIRLIKDIIIMYGAGGTGKSTWAANYDVIEDESKEERIYRRNADDAKYWGSGRTAYHGQRIVHYEEFCGQEKLQDLKRICDVGHSGPDINIKNSGGTLNHEMVIFTSNTHPAGWYRNAFGDDPKQFHPFWRRVTKVLFFPSHRPNGNMNIPDEVNPPYFVDQTQDWENMAGDYAKCVVHANEYWPLPERGGTDPNMAYDPTEAWAPGQMNCARGFNPGP